jgi:hypothetical protein
VELTVIPVPENEATAPLTKLVPVMLMLWLVAPCPRELGFADVTVGVATVTDLLGLSIPTQLSSTGVTEYCQVPLGTVSSVQVSPAMVPEQLAPIVWSTPPLVYRLIV